MNKILKNYFRNFLKNWVETFGFLVFIIMLFCSLIGVISSPLQMFIEKTAVTENTVLPEYSVNLNSSQLNSYVTYRELYNCNYEYTHDEISRKYNQKFINNDAYKSIFLMSYADYYSWDISSQTTSDYSKLKALSDYYDNYYKEKNEPIIIDEESYWDLSSWDSNDTNTFVIDESKVIYSSTVSGVNKYVVNIFNNYSTNNSKTSLIKFDLSTPNTIKKDYFSPKEVINSENKVVNLISQKGYYNNINIYLEKIWIDYYNNNISENNFNLNTEISWDYTYKNKNWKLSVVSSDYDYGNIFIDKTKEINYDTDNLVITSGRKPIYRINGDKEVVLSSAFAKINKINVGDYINMNYSSNGITKFKVVGFGEKYSYLYPSNFDMVSQKFKDTGYVYMPYEQMEDIYTTELNNSFDNSCISSFNYKLNIRTHNNVSVNNLFTINGSPLFGDTSSVLIKYSSTDNYSEVKMQSIQMIVYFILAIVIIMLAFIFVNFIIKKELNQTRKQIGIFKASGYKISELAWIFTLKEYFSVLIGIFIGWLVSFPIQQYVAANWQQQTTVYLQPIAYGWIYLSLIFILIPFLIGAISFVMNYSYLKENIISLINNPRKVKNKKDVKLNSKKLQSSNMKLFSFKLMNSFTKQSIWKFVIINFLMFFTCLITFLELSALDLLKQTINSAYVQYNNKYKSGYLIKSSSVPSLWKSEESFNVVNGDSNVEFINYESTDDNNDAIVQYIEKNNTSSTLLANNYKNLMQTISSHVLNDPSSLYIPSSIDEIKDMLISNMQPALITLLFTDMNQEEENYYSNYDDLYTKAKNNVISILGEITSDQTDKIDMSNTIFGAYSQNENSNLFNFLYLKDITRTLMSIIYSSSVSDYITKNNIDTSDMTLLKAIINDHFKGDLKIDINDQSKWSSILTSSDSDSGSNSGGSSDDNNDSDSDSFLNSLEPELFSILYSAISANTSENYNPLMTLNQVYYSTKNEALSYDITYSRDDSSTASNLFALDFHSLYNNDQFNLGNPKNIYNFTGVTNSEMKKLYQTNSDGSINVIISSLDNKLYNLNIGDTFTINPNAYHNLKIKVCGIATKMTFSHDLFCDYKTLMYNYSDTNISYNKNKDYYYLSNIPDVETTDIIKQLPINYLFSGNEMYSGNVDTSDISGTIKSLKYTAPSFSINIKDNSSLFATIFYNTLKTNSLFKEIVNKTNISIYENSNTIINPSFIDQSGTDNNGISFSISITKKFIANLTKKATIIIYMFICLSTVLIIIILSVVMNIIIDESIQVILTLKALGYKKYQINIIVLGNYIISGLVLFALSWIANMATWIIACKIIWDNTQILLSVPTGIIPPIFNFCLVTGILLIGYFACDFKNRKYPITKIFD